MARRGNAKEDTVLCFQDTLAERDAEEDVSLVFFELANAPFVSYRYRFPILPKANANEHDQSKNNNGLVVIKQDVSACGEHTGGIVWETAYLLLQYLQQSCTGVLGKTLEVGAGCGLVGQILHKCGVASEVVMTETQPVMVNLISNMERNDNNKQKQKNHHKQDSSSSSSKIRLLQAVQLDWNCYEKDAAKGKLQPHSFDTIVGTDVVFSTKLVEPLLETMRFLGHDSTVAYLCLQERCKDSHQLLLNKAKKHDWIIEDISDQVTAHATCEWGKQLECKILKFTIRNKGEKRKR
jgi:predicted nicotinamide N-methyase